MVIWAVIHPMFQKMLLFHLPRLKNVEADIVTIFDDQKIIWKYPETYSGVYSTHTWKNGSNLVNDIDLYENKHTNFINSINKFEFIIRVFFNLAY